MPIPVKLSEVVDEMSMSGDEISTYLNRVTGEMVTVTAEENGLPRTRRTGTFFRAGSKR